MESGRVGSYDYDEWCYQQKEKEREPVKPSRGTFVFGEDYARASGIGCAACGRPQSIRVKAKIQEYRYTDGSREGTIAIQKDEVWVCIHCGHRNTLGGTCAWENKGWR